MSVRLLLGEDAVLDAGIPGFILPSGNLPTLREVTSRVKKLSEDRELHQ